MKLYGKSKTVAASYVTIAASYSHKNPPGSIGIGMTYFQKIKKYAKTVAASYGTCSCQLQIGCSD
jgi:hypothetical protein